MAAFVDLTRASMFQMQTGVVCPPRNEVSDLSSSLQASRSYHYPLFQSSQHGTTNDDKGIDLSMDKDEHVYPLPATSTITRKPVCATKFSGSLIEPSPPRSKSSRPNCAHSMDKARRLSITHKGRRGHRSFHNTSSSRSLEAPFSHIALRAASPLMKRRRIGPDRPPIIGHHVNQTPSQHSEAELEDVESKNNTIDLTIDDNLPADKYSKTSLKRGIIDVSKKSGHSESNSKVAQNTSHLSNTIDSSVSSHEAEVNRRHAAPGIRRRLAALGRMIRIDPQVIIDLSGDSESDAEDEYEPEVTKEPFCRPSVFGPEDYLDDDEMSELLANLDIGPNRRASMTPKSSARRTEIEEYSQGNSRYKTGKCAELKDGTFLRIVSVFKDENCEVFLSGHLLSRQSSWGSAMPKRKNELVWTMEISNADFEAGFDPRPTEVKVIEALGIRNVTFTNQQYPGMSLKTHVNGGFRNVHEELSTGPLFCRWKSVRIIGEQKQASEYSLVHLCYAEADPKPNARIPTAAVRDTWRGCETVLGGSHSTKRQSSINLISRLSSSTSEQIRQYTFGDAFCGAGGCSSGASQAGLHVKWGFDKDKDPITVYATNIGRREGAESLNEAVDQFCGRRDIDRFMVDILHMSPPCQPFSAAHTVPSEIQDEINRAAILSVEHLLKKIKPRVATIEETEGLINRHVDWFNALINSFVSQGYSVRWKVVKCQDYAVPQQRRRLFIIGAGAGEILPPFARPTHGEQGSGLQAFKKIRHYIRDIPHGATQHVTSDRFPRGPRLPFSDDQFAKTLTCSGGVGNYHPSGLRLYTIRELASLQTFPISYSFTLNSKTKARRQIGNAVPPLLARAMFREIIKCLKEADRLEALAVHDRARAESL